MLHSYCRCGSSRVPMMASSTTGEEWRRRRRGRVMAWRASDGRGGGRALGAEATGGGGEMRRERVQET